MRGLKIAAIASVSLLIVMVLMVGYLFLTAEVRVTSVQVEGVSAANDPAAFEALKTSVVDETFQGTLYQKPLEWGEADDYVYLNYTLRLRNDCLVPIDMIEVQVVPQATDILQIGDFTVKSLEPKSEGDLSVQILVPKDTHSVRELIVTYYVWGVSFNLKTTYGM